MTVYIYALIDPRDNSSRYVGMTRDPNKRLYQHRSKSHNEEIKVWASELDDLGLSPTMRILEEVDDGDDWRISETYWVRQALKEGWPILNKKTGGDNSPLHFMTDPPDRRIFRSLYVTQPTAYLLVDVEYMKYHWHSDMLPTALMALDRQDQKGIYTVQHREEYFEHFAIWWQKAPRDQNGYPRIPWRRKRDTEFYQMYLSMKKETGDLLDELAARFVGSRRRGYDATLYAAFHLVSTDKCNSKDNQ